MLGGNRTTTVAKARKSKPLETKESERSLVKNCRSVITGNFIRTDVKRSNSIRERE